MLREGGGGGKVRAPPPMQHLSHLEIIIHHASPATGECVVLFNGCHWHNSSSYHPQPVTKLLLLQQGYIFLHLCGDVMCVFLPVRRFAEKKGWFLWVYGGCGKFHCGAIWSHQLSAKCRNVLTFSFNSAKYGFPNNQPDKHFLIVKVQNWTPDCISRGLIAKFRVEMEPLVAKFWSLETWNMDNK